MSEKILIGEMTAIRRKKTKIERERESRTRRGICVSVFRSQGLSRCGSAEILPRNALYVNAGRVLQVHCNHPRSQCKR